MCGFLTEFCFGNNGLSESKHFEGLLALSKHRGPDSTHVVQGVDYHMGFNRLAVLDLSENGNQPKYSPSKRYHVVFNGEIYNYKELEKQYGLKCLTSTSDTEILVHLLDVLGVAETLTVLNGMFAMAIIDIQTNTFYLARDFAGIKPLFYGVSKQGIVAASQFNQIFKHDWFKAQLELRPDVVKEYFGFGYMPAPNTIYRDIFQVNPGTYLKISDTGAISSFVFKAFSKDGMSRFSDAKDETADVMDAVIGDSVRQQLVSDVPLACFLSGGIDSPLIVAMAKRKQESIKGYTIGVSEAELDERKAASAYAKHLDLEQHIHTIEAKDLLASIDVHFGLLSEPFGDYSSVPTYLISKIAKQGNTVMLSGDGGDELFFGYPRMLDVIKKRWWFVIPFGIRKPLVRLFNKLGIIRTWAPYHYKSLADFIKSKQQYVFKDDLDAFFPSSAFSKELDRLYCFENSMNKNRLLQGLRYTEFYGHLQRVLVKVDRMSMANSLEVRVPFLGKQVIDRAWQMDSGLGREHAILKKVLRDVMRRYYPDTLITSGKKGFAVPMDHWLRNQLREDVETLIFDMPFYASELMDVEAVRGYVRRFYDRQHGSAWGVWHVYAWQKWAVSEGVI
ncbi:asparagine synthase (glutamine-hydrolyzing) [Snuella sedimenti]|uniref:asparagine synthase (glutamine-hydrolyzing) n=1 Tax=Snuella sedimenti TaxID=2798802 RepID=A0A8J7J2P4_9FLAO|nr:asparagine synthase (glutamine-hydrolyzing) [Snuella sedimenti]MBJ6367904.1 asparagine synthase (glutamine-hydrolyzing) [Snuella sedimenti]